MARLVPGTFACLVALGLAACEEESPVAPASALRVTCEARPATGPAPLAVSFLVGVSGASGQVSVAVSYGDGQTGSSAVAAHTYAVPGSYAASFDVTTQTQSARCSTLVTVTGAAPPSGNQPPVAVFKTTPTDVGRTITGKAPLVVSFNMCLTSDPEKDELYFLMDFDGDETFDFGGITGYHCRADRTYALGTWKAVNCVHDRDANRIPLHDDTCKAYTIVATP